MSQLDEICPMYVGSEALKLTLSDPLVPARAYRAVDIDVDYAGASELGVRLPLELLVVGPTAQSFRRHVYRRVAPSVVTFTPHEGGAFLVLLREVGHNKLRGRLSIQVEGDVSDRSQLLGGLS